MSRLPRNSFPSLLLLLLLFIIILASSVAASSGDREPGYQHCLQTCKGLKCADGKGSNLSPILRATFWTCEADCAYHCTHSFTSSRPASQPVQQFYGKWPFWRILGMQEPASVVFSLGNGWIHYQAIRKIRRRVSDSNPLKPWLYALASIQLNTWLWSAIFHMRDTKWTERLDYFAATLTIMGTLHYTIQRLFHLYPTGPSRVPISRSQLALTLVFSVLYVSHITYLLSSPTLDYGYNVAFNVVIGAIHLSFWTLFSLVFTTRLPFPLSLMPTPYPPQDPLAITPKPTYRWTSGALVLATSASMSLELFDFPPLGRVIDAHSLWHAATILLANGWYAFLIRDANLMLSTRSGELGRGEKSDLLD